MVSTTFTKEDDGEVESDTTGSTATDDATEETTVPMATDDSTELAFKRKSTKQHGNQSLVGIAFRFVPNLIDAACRTRASTLWLGC